MQLVVLVGFDETLKQFDAGSQFSPAPCVRRALGFVKDSHVRHIRDNVYVLGTSRPFADEIQQKNIVKAGELQNTSEGQNYDPSAWDRGSHEIVHLPNLSAYAPTLFG